MDISEHSEPKARGGRRIQYSYDVTRCERQFVCQDCHMVTTRLRQISLKNGSGVLFDRALSLKKLDWKHHLSTCLHSREIQKIFNRVRCRKLRKLKIKSCFFINFSFSFSCYFHSPSSYIFLWFSQFLLLSVFSISNIFFKTYSLFTQKNCVMIRILYCIESQFNHT